MEGRWREEEGEPGVGDERQCWMVVLVRWGTESGWGPCTSGESSCCQGTHLLYLGCSLLRVGFKAIINFVTESYTGRQTSGPVPSIGVGVGLAFVLLALQVITSLCIHHFFYRSASTGVLLRGGLIAGIYARALHFTSRARSTLTNGKLINHISTDVSRVDYCAGLFHIASLSIFCISNSHNSHSP